MPCKRRGAPKGASSTPRGRAGKTCWSTPGAQTCKCADTRSVRARSTQARRARRRARRASARSTQARGRAVARCSRPSGPAFLFSFGRVRKFAGRCRDGGAPGVGPQEHRASPAPPRTHAKHLSHSRGAVKVSGAPGCLVSCSSFQKGARVSRVRRIQTRERLTNSEEAKHIEVSQTLECAVRIGIRAAQTILEGYSMNTSLSKEKPFSRSTSRIGAKLHAGDANQILKTSFHEMALRTLRQKWFSGVVR